MNIISIIGAGIIAAMICILLRQYKPEYAMLVSLAAGIFIMLAVFIDMMPVIDEIRSLIDRTSAHGEYVEVLLKALGICFLTQAACDACKDAGESAIAGKLEMAGKIAVLLISLPLFRQVLGVVYSLIGP